jgi:hypothetical protein
MRGPPSFFKFQVSGAMLAYAPVSNRLELAALLATVAIIGISSSLKTGFGSRSEEES